MPEMKDSGIEWIGEIPKEWSISKLKYELSEPMKYGASEVGIDYDTNLYRYIRITDITTDGKLKNEGKISLSESQAKGYILKNNTVLFARSGGTVGKSFLYKKEYGKSAFAGYLISAVADNKKMYPKWLMYYTGSSSYKEWTNMIFNQATIQNIGADKYSNMQIPIAPLDEQNRIIDFLDSKCSEIDALTADIQKEIEVLEEYKKSVITEAVTKGLNPNVEMKDSGIEWIGEIPSHWSISKIKYHLRRRETRNPGNVQVLSVYREFGVIPKDSRDDNHNVTSEDTSKYKYVKPGVLVINKMKAWQGSMGVSEYEGIVSPAYFIYEFTDEFVLGGFLHYLLRNVYKDEFRRISGGIREGQWDLPASGFENELLPIPPMDEQKNIVAYLNDKIKNINEAISEKNTQLTTLEEYKKSVIYEYVTGKKEVTAQ